MPGSTTTTGSVEQPGWTLVSEGRRSLAIDERSFALTDGTRLTVARFGPAERVRPALQGCWRPAFHRRRFSRVRQLQGEIDSWLVDYNNRRPHEVAVSAVTAIDGAKNNIFSAIEPEFMSITSTRAGIRACNK